MSIYKSQKLMTIGILFYFILFYFVVFKIFQLKIPNHALCMWALRDDLLHDF